MKWPPCPVVTCHAETTAIEGPRHEEIPKDLCMPLEDPRRVLFLLRCEGGHEAWWAFLPSQVDTAKEQP